MLNQTILVGKIKKIDTKELEKEEKRQIVEVVAEKVTFLSNKKSEGGIICE